MPENTSAIVQAIHEMQQAARDFWADPIPGCSPLCPGNCEHKTENQIWTGRS